MDISSDTLKKVAKRVKIEEELKKLEIKSEKLKLRAEIEEIDASEEIRNIEQNIAELTKDKEELDSFEHPFFDLIDKQTTLQERLSKLEEKKHGIQTTVYESLKNEYLGEKRVVDEQINEIINQLREISQSASKGAQSLSYSIEELSVRKDIEEIPDDIYDQQFSNLKSELEQSEELKAAADFLLDMVKK